MARLLGKVAIVTGAGSGIGRAVAIAFAKEGARVVVNDRRTDGQGEATAQAICAAGGEAIYVAADVSREEDVKRLVASAVDAFGRLDVMVNNAGVMVAKPLQELTEEDFDLVTSVNQKGTFFGTKHAIPAMVAAGGGSNHQHRVDRGRPWTARRLRLRRHEGRHPLNDPDGGGRAGRTQHPGELRPARSDRDGDSGRGRPDGDTGADRTDPPRDPAWPQKGFTGGLRGAFRVPRLRRVCFHHGAEDGGGRRDTGRESHHLEIRVALPGRQGGGDPR